MKNYNQEEEVQESTFLSNEWPIHASYADRDEDDEREDEEESEEDGDWGDVDPAGIDADLRGVLYQSQCHFNDLRH